MSTSTWTRETPRVGALHIGNLRPASGQCRARSEVGLAAPPHHVVQNFVRIYSATKFANHERHTYCTRNMQNDPLVDDMGTTVCSFSFGAPYQAQGRVGTSRCAAV